MSDPTKKSIVINESFLSGLSKRTGNYGSLIENSRNLKKNSRYRLTDEIIKPNKLKKMLLDKINAKRKAEHTSTRTLNDMESKENISKESKIFSSEFKKSLDFLDNYVKTKNVDKYRSKTLRKQNAASLNHDIIKSLHNNNALYPTTNIIQPVIYTQNPIHQLSSAYQHHPPIQQHQPYQQHNNISLPSYGASQNIHGRVPYAQTPIFQKIDLQIQPPKPVIHESRGVPKINLYTGNTNSENLIYTELPPELQLQPISPIYPPLVPLHEPFTNSMDSMNSIELSNMSQLGEMGEINNVKTSLITSTSTFSPLKLSDDLPYGCLKNGTKPTYRSYNKTIKHNLRFNTAENGNGNGNVQQPQSERQIKLQELKDKHNKKPFLSESINDHTYHTVHADHNEHNKTRHLSTTATRIRRRLRKTITRKFKLGKQGDVVGVLIKNNDTRKKIQREHGLLKKKQISEVKQYLVEQNLIKIGSTAPPNIIRKIYEDAMLTGEVENVGKGVILHNFLEDKKAW